MITQPATSSRSFPCRLFLLSMAMMGMALRGLSAEAASPQVPWECSNYTDEAQTRCLNAFIERQQEQIAQLEGRVQAQQGSGRTVERSGGPTDSGHGTASTAAVAAARCHCDHAASLCLSVYLCVPAGGHRVVPGATMGRARLLRLLWPSVLGAPFLLPALWPTLVAAYRQFTSQLPIG